MELVWSLEPLRSFARHIIIAVHTKYFYRAQFIVELVDVGYIGSKPYPNNSLINLEDIGEGEAGLHCFTELKTCCKNNGHRPNGQWILPNGLTVGSQNNEPNNFSETRNQNCIILNRNSRATGPTGTFTCVIPDVNGDMLYIFFRVYDRQEGMIF